MTAFRLLEGECLAKSPDLVLVDFYGPGSFTLIDVKVSDPARRLPLSHTTATVVRISAHACLGAQIQYVYST